MTLPRKQLIAVEDTPYYHIVSRCVRRSFLCGTDKQTGQNYEHRRQWIEDRIRILSSIFAIDICSYAVMSNHLHIVVKLVPVQSDEWDETDVLKHWTSLFKGPFLVQKFMSGAQLDKAERAVLSTLIEQYRERLSNLGWFMKCLNEPIARQANKEDNCTGHFWEARYKSQALLTEEALLSCMAYVDLNPIRAKMSNTPEQSDHTSIKERIVPCFNLQQAIQQQLQQQILQQFDLPLKPLLNFEGNTTKETQTGILFSLTEYLQLVDDTGRMIRPDKCGAIPEQTAPILERLAISHPDWLENATQFEKNYRRKFAKKRQRKNNPP
jgi:REP element-mobilizing transposase RayT